MSVHTENQPKLQSIITIQKHNGTEAPNLLIGFDNDPSVSRFFEQRGVQPYQSKDVSRLTLRVLLRELEAMCDVNPDRYEEKCADLHSVIASTTNDDKLIVAHSLVGHPDNAFTLTFDE